MPIGHVTRLCAYAITSQLKIYLEKFMVLHHFLLHVIILCNWAHFGHVSQIALINVPTHLDKGCCMPACCVFNQCCLNLITAARAHVDEKSCINFKLFELDRGKGKGEDEVKTQKHMKGQEQDGGSCPLEWPFTVSIWCYSSQPLKIKSSRHGTPGPILFQLLRSSRLFFCGKKRI